MTNQNPGKWPIGRVESKNQAGSGGDDQAGPAEVIDRKAGSKRQALTWDELATEGSRPKGKKNHKTKLNKNGSTRGVPV